MANSQTPSEKLTTKIASLSTDQLMAGVVAIGGGVVSVEQRLVRALMIDEFIAREGTDAGDMLMESVGL